MSSDQKHDDLFTSREQYARMRTILKTTHALHQRMRHANDQQTFMQDVCEYLTANHGYARAWVAFLDANGLLHGGCDASRVESTLSFVDRLCAGKAAPCISQALETEGLVIIEDPVVACGDCIFKAAFTDCSVMSVRLMYENRILGVLSIAMPSVWLDIKEEQAFFVDLAEELAFALHRIEQEERNKRVGWELGEQGRILMNILEDTLSGYWDWNIPAHTEYLSPTFKSMFGYEDHELPNSPDSWQRIIYQEDLPRVFENFDLHVSTRGQVPFYNEVRYHHKNGSVIWVICVGRVIEWADDGSPIRVVGCHVDITQRKEAEAELRKSESRYRSLFHNKHTVMLLVDPKSGKIEDANPAAEAFYGWSRQELKGMTITQINTLSAEQIHAEMNKAREEQRSNYHFQHRLHDGTVRDVDVHSGPIMLDNRSLLYSFVFDVTDRRQAEEALRRSEQRFRGIFDYALSGVALHELVFDENGHAIDYRILDVNPAYERIMEIPRSKAVGALATTLYETDEAPFLEKYAALVREMRAERFEDEVREFGRWFSVSVSPLPENRFATIFVDITERKQIVQELHQAKATLQAAMDNSSAGIAIADAPSGVLRYVNDAGLLIRGGEREELVDGVGIDQYVSTWQILDLDGSPLPTDEVPLVRAIKYGEESSRDFIIRRAEEDDHVVTAKASPILNQNGELEAGVVVFLDITEQKKMSAQLQQMEKMDAIGTLAGGVAHDYNNQLTGIQGYAEMLKARLEDPTLKRYAENILIGAERSADLTRKLLAFSRRAELISASTDVHSLIHEVTGILSHSIDKKVELKTVLDAEESVVLCDPSQVQNALLNLAINAAHAMPDGGEITIETSNVELDEELCQRQSGKVAPGSYLRVRIADTGTGIPENILNRIFEPFFTTKPKSKGTGMGLAAVYGTVEQHQGAIDVESVVGEGTTFSVYLPLRTATPVPAVSRDLPVIIKGDGHILLVDDEELSLRLTNDMLTSLGYSVQMEPGGVSAVEYYRENWQRIDLVLLDLMMPKQDGVDVFRALQEINPRVKALIFSGYALNDKVRGLLERGAKDFLQKPFDQAVLSQKIGRILQG